MFKKLRQKKDFRVFMFTVFNAIVAFIGTQLLNLEGNYAVIATGLAIPFLNAFTKFINTTLFNDIGVDKKK